ncbi:hypothetical protein EG329_011105 [Mollisiaceae sp. DMI_Dod_QoI]|nr:hypothetical protein EG329_011105 [Helotiales sp. DMI_Dod_QoI]
MSGKQPDLSTEWTEWAWSEEHGCKYSTRYGPTGEVEYDFLTPEETQETQETPRYTPEWPAGGATDHENAPSGTPQYITSKWKAPPEYGQQSSFTPASSMSQQTRTSTSRRPNSRTHTGSRNRDDKSKGDITQNFQEMSLDQQEDQIGELPEIALEGAGGEVKIAKQITSSVSNKPLSNRYTVVDERKSKKFWKPGRVFMTPRFELPPPYVLWTEPARHEGGATTGSHFATVWLGERVFSEIRRFVVIGEGYGNVICSPIHTYNGQATLKNNLPDPQQHAIIHTSKRPPPELCEYDNEGNVILREALSKDPIRVVSELDDEYGDLGTYSRINYAKIYTVEKYVRVLNIGKVHDDSMESLLTSCFFMRPDDQPPQGPRKSKHDSKSKDNQERREDRGQSSKTSHHKRKH